VDTPDLDALASAAESLAATYAGPAAVSALISELNRAGVTVRVLDAGPNSEGVVTSSSSIPPHATWPGGRPGAHCGCCPLRHLPRSGLVAAVWFSELAVRAKLLAIVMLAGSFLPAGPAPCWPPPAGKDGSGPPSTGSARRLGC